jgi:hypothetical protein
MNFQNRKYYFVEATEDDGDAILEILEEPDFKGDLSIIYTRRPNPTISFYREGEKVMIMLCKLKETHELIGFGCCTVQTLYVNAKETKVGYLSGLRVKKKYRMMPFLLIDAYNELIKWIKQQNIKLLYTTVLEANVKVQKMFEKKRRRFPNYIPVAEYTVYCSTVRLKKPEYSGYIVRSATTDDVGDILDLLGRARYKYDLFPKLNKEGLMGNTDEGLHYSQFYIARSKVDGSICACVYVWNQIGYKQHIIGGYNGIYKVLKHLSPVLPYVGYPKLPKEGSVLKYYTLSFFNYKEGCLEAMELLIKHIARKSTESSYFLMGVTKDDELNPMLSRLAKITYKSKLYMVDYEKTEESAKRIDNLGSLYLECGRL